MINPLHRVLTPGPSPNPSAASYSSIALALTGFIIWALNQYVFHGKLPTPVEIALYAVVPGVVGWFAVRIARVHTIASITSGQAQPVSQSPSPVSQPAVPFPGQLTGGGTNP